MKILAAGIALIAAAAAATPASAQGACQPGTYRAADGDFVVLVPSPAVPAPGLRYQFRDGRRGATNEAGAPLTCQAETVGVGGKAWPKIAKSSVQGSKTPAPWP